MQDRAGHCECGKTQSVFTWVCFPIETSACCNSFTEFDDDNSFLEFYLLSNSEIFSINRSGYLSDSSNKKIYRTNIKITEDNAKKVLEDLLKNICFI